MARGQRAARQSHRHRHAAAGLALTVTPAMPQGPRARAGGRGLLEAVRAAAEGGDPDLHTVRSRALTCSCP